MVGKQGRLNKNSEFRIQKSEVRSQKSEVRSQKSEFNQLKVRAPETTALTFQDSEGLIPTTKDKGSDRLGCGHVKI
ncbi:MAG: hypothetical protein V7K27_20270 [Nostoc sp.]